MTIIKVGTPPEQLGGANPPPLPVLPPIRPVDRKARRGKKGK